MKVTDIEVGKLLPYWNNARNNDKTVEKIVTSIKEYGFTVPLVVNKDMVLITGHARLKAAKKLGLKTVPCVLVDMTEDQAKKYRIADNKIQESTEWNEEALFKELREIGDPMELVNMGFELKEIEEIVGDIDSLVEDAEEMAQTVPEYTVSAQRPIEGDKYMPPMQNGDYERSESVSEPQAQPMITNTRSVEDIEKELKKREQELNGRFVQESYEQTKYDNIVVCPHCGQQFKVRGLK